MILLLGTDALTPNCGREFAGQLSLARKVCAVLRSGKTKVYIRALGEMFLSQVTLGKIELCGVAPVTLTVN